MLSDVGLDDLVLRFDEVQLAFGPRVETYAASVHRALADLSHPEPGDPARRRPCLVELGCGTATVLASLGWHQRQLRRIGVETDPVLLHLARRAVDVELVDADFTDPAWLTAADVQPGHVDVVLAVVPCTTPVPTRSPTSTPMSPVGYDPAACS